jgi:hypothetical protein
VGCLGGRAVWLCWPMTRAPKGMTISSLFAVVAVSHRLSRIGQVDFTYADTVKQSEKAHS